MFRSTWTVMTLTCLALLGSPAWSQEGEDPSAAPTAEEEGRSQLKGQVFAGDKDRAVGATVEIYNLSSQKTFRSEPTDKGGNFQFEELPRGYYDVAVFTEDGMYVVNQVVEVAPGGVNVNFVRAGPVDTDSLRSFPTFDDLVEESRRRPPGRMGRPEDIAPVVSFLLSPDARWIRGQVIVADGGLGLF